MEKTRSIAEFLRLIERDYRKETALAEKHPDGWFKMSHHEFLYQVKALTLYLHSMGLKKGEMVGILAVSGIRWIIADLAIMVCGGITVPLFSNISNEHFVHECKQTNLKTLFVSGAQSWMMYGKHRNLFKKVIAMDPLPPEEASVSYDQAIVQGISLFNKHPDLFDEILDRIHENDIASIVYTSSSTGVPKGVVLSHKNILAISFNKILEAGEADRFLSFLPLAHIYARAINFYLLRWNISIYFFNEVKELAAVCQSVKPTMMSFVPRVLEKIYAQMVSKVNEEGFLKRSIAQWAFNIALDEHFEEHFFAPLADRVVYQKLRDSLGGELRCVLCGSATLNPTLNYFFNHIGIPVYEGYGLTEMMVVSVNTRENSKVGTVGKPCPGVEVKISQEGEILVRAEGVMQGYYKNHKLTQKALDKAGWLHTGDKGSMDGDEFIKIYGRIQEIVKSSTGEWIASAPLEQELGKAPFVEFSMVVAEGRKFVSALIFPNFDVVHALKKSQNLEHLADEEYLNSDHIKPEMDKLIEAINAHHDHWEQIHAYRFVLSNPTIETGELTPTLKIRRRNVMEKYKDLIDSMYPEGPSTQSTKGP